MSGPRGQTRDAGLWPLWRNRPLAGSCSCRSGDRRRTRAQPASPPQGSGIAFAAGRSIAAQSVVSDERVAVLPRAARFRDLPDDDRYQTRTQFAADDADAANQPLKARRPACTLRRRFAADGVRTPPMASVRRRYRRDRDKRAPLPSPSLASIQRIGFLLFIAQVDPETRKSV